MVKKVDDQAELLKEYEEKAKEKLEQRLKGEFGEAKAEKPLKNPKELEKLKLSNIKQYRKEMRRIKKVTAAGARERKIASGELVEMVPLTPEEKKAQMRKRLKKMREKAAKKTENALEGDSPAEKMANYINSIEQTPITATNIIFPTTEITML